MRVVLIIAKIHPENIYGTGIYVTKLYQYEIGPEMFLNCANDINSEHVFMVWNGDNTT